MMGKYCNKVCARAPALLRICNRQNTHCRSIGPGCTDCQAPGRNGLVKSRRQDFLVTC
jgi:hypothetical protein